MTGRLLLIAAALWIGLTAVAVPAVASPSMTWTLQATPANDGVNLKSASRPTPGFCMAVGLINQFRCQGRLPLERQGSAVDLDVRSRQCLGRPRRELPDDDLVHGGRNHRE